MQREAPAVAPELGEVVEVVVVVEAALVASHEEVGRPGKGRHLQSALVLPLAFGRILARIPDSG